MVGVSDVVRIPWLLKRAVPDRVKRGARAFRRALKQTASPERTGRLIRDVYAAVEHMPEIVVLDVGARGGVGQLHAPLARVGALRYFGVDPDAVECERLRAAHPSHQFFAVALGSRAEERTLHITRRPGCSSLLTPNASVLERFGSLAGHFDVVRDEHVSVVNLDGFIAEHSIGRVDLLAIDAQGSEYDILLGGSDALRGGVGAVDVEVHFSAIYQGERTFPEIDGLLRDAGFALHDLSGDVSRRWTQWGKIDLVASGGFDGAYDGELIEADALYFCEPSGADRAAVLRAVVLAVLYGKRSRAVHVVKSYGRECLSAKERSMLLCVLDDRTSATAW